MLPVHIDGVTIPLEELAAFTCQSQAMVSHRLCVAQSWRSVAHSWLSVGQSVTCGGVHAGAHKQHVHAQADEPPQDLQLLALLLTPQFEAESCTPHGLGFGSGSTRSSSSSISLSLPGASPAARW